VGDWLPQLGLGQYDAVFRESEIDSEVLPELTDADLEKARRAAGPPGKRLLKRSQIDCVRASDRRPRASRLPRRNRIRPGDGN